MNCYVHDRVAAVGVCAACQRARCRECLSYAVGGAAIGPAIIDGRRCDPAALEFLRQWWLGSFGLPPSCR